MNLTSELEEKLGIDISTLRREEKVVYENMLASVEKAKMTPNKMRGHIIAMRDAVERELVNEPEFNRIFIFKVENRRQIFLKARLLNYLLLESFLISPQKAKERLEEVVSGLVKPKA